MDKRQEAINWFKEEVDRLKEDSQYRPLLLIAIGALEKQIAKKPLTETKTDYRVSYKFAYCFCGRSVQIGEKYCSECGQAISWKGE